MVILLIEGDGHLRDDVRSMLRAQGHRVKIVDEGADALIMLRKCIFDLIVTSLMAGHMRVVEFAIAAKSLQPRTPIVVTGGYFGPNPAIPFVDAIVQQPVSLPDLGRAVSLLLGASAPPRRAHPPSYLRRNRRRVPRHIKKDGD